MLKNLTTFLVIINLLGCTTMQTIEQPVAPALRENLKVGDQVSVLAKNRMTYNIKVTGFEPDAMIGFDAPNSKSWKIPYNQIVRIDYTRVTAATKVGAVAGGIVVTLYLTALTLVAIAIYSLNH